MSYEIRHFGVKGMKWGIRKNDPMRSTEGFFTRDKARVAGQSYMWDAIKNDPMFTGMSEDDYKALSNRGKKFVEGTTLRRVQFSEETALKGATFVSKLKEDSEFYRAILPAASPSLTKNQVMGAKKYKVQAYEVEMKTVQKLSAPSDKVRFDTFMDILGKPAVKLPDRTAPITGRQYLEDLGYKPFFKTQTDRELAFRAYNDFVSSQGHADSPLNPVYFQALKDKGYNALKDGNDAGRYTKNPLILLDAGNQVKIKSIRPLTADEINQAQRNLGVNRKARKERLKGVKEYNS